MDGYVKLHRKVFRSPVWQDPDLFRLWTYCLLKASHKERTVVLGKQEIKLNIGEFVTGRFALFEEFNSGVAPSKRVKELTLWRLLKLLEKMGNLNIKTTNKYSVVSVVNWCLYQEELTTNEQQLNNKRTTTEQQLNTNKNVKNVNNVKNVKKNIYSEFVKLTDEEYQKLIDQLGELLTKDMIERLNNYIGSKGKDPYKSHYHTILNWRRKDEGKNPKGKGKQNEVNPYDNAF